MLQYILQLLNYCFPVFVKGGEYDNIEALLRQLVNSVGSHHLRLYKNDLDPSPALPLPSGVIL